MYRRSLIAAALTVAVLVLAAPQTGAQDEADINVLLLPDSMGSPADGYGPGTDALIDAFEAAGFVVTVGPIEYEWNGTNPPLDGSDVVVHLNGVFFLETVPILGQHALVDFVRSGGGYVGGQWNGFEARWDLLTEMDDLVLQLWEGSSDNCSGCTMTWNVVPSQKKHPVVEGIPTSFSFFAGGHESPPVVDFDEFPPVVLMTSLSGEPAVIVREFMGGKIVNFSSAANHLVTLAPPERLTLEEPEIQQLYVNAVSWAASASTAPGSTLDDLRAAVEDLRESGAINNGRANALLSKIDSAEREIDRGDLDAAENKLWVFVNQVDAWIRSGVLTLEEGELLLAIAHEIIANLAS